MNSADAITVNNITQNNSGNVSITNTGAMTTAVWTTITTQGGSVSLTTVAPTAPDSTEPVLTINGGITTNGGAISSDGSEPR